MFIYTFKERIDIKIVSKLFNGSNLNESCRLKYERVDIKIV